MLRAKARSVELQAYSRQVKISIFIHRGLKKLNEDDRAKGVPPNTVDTLPKMFTFLDDMKDPEEFRALAAWRAYTLTGERNGENCDMNLEAYH